LELHHGLQAVFALQWLNTGNDCQEHCTTHVVRNNCCLLATRVGFDLSPLRIGGATQHAWRIRIIHVQSWHVHLRRMSAHAAVLLLHNYGCGTGADDEPKGWRVQFVVEEGFRVQSSTEQKQHVMHLESPRAMF
jgi:hypothetical protein